MISQERIDTLLKSLDERILLLDGAMGTMTGIVTSKATTISCL
jgi:methionine synthase I (cobalamin-dependent)